MLHGTMAETCCNMVPRCKTTFVSIVLPWVINPEEKREVKVWNEVKTFQACLKCCAVQTLAELQDRLQPFPTDIALQLIEEELGEPASAILSEITPEPVAAASLGQVLSVQMVVRKA